MTTANDRLMAEIDADPDAWFAKYEAEENTRRAFAPATGDTVGLQDDYATKADRNTLFTVTATQTVKSGRNKGLTEYVLSRVGGGPGTRCIGHGLRPATDAEKTRAAATPTADRLHVGTGFRIDLTKVRLRDVTADDTFVVLDENKDGTVKAAKINGTAAGGYYPRLPLAALVKVNLGVV